MPYGFHRLSVFGGVVFVEGWSTIGLPAVIYDDPETTVTQVVESLDVGPDKTSFRIRAVVSMLDLSHDRIIILFKDGTIAENSTAAAVQGDHAYRAMFARFHRETERGGRLLEIGSRARSGNVHRHLFSSKVDYLGMDIKAGVNVDIVGDAHELMAVVGDGFDFIFSNAVFEHLLMPWKVAIEMGHALNDGGYALVASHSAFPLHEEPWDFWRYSENAWRGLFNKHTGFEMVDAQYSVPCAMTTDFSYGPPLQGIDRHRNFVFSACLVRKVGTPTVEWKSPAAEVYDLQYDH